MANVLKEPQPGKLATTGQLGKVIRELNGLGQVYGQSPGGKPAPSIVVPIRIDSATDARAFYNITQFVHPRNTDPTSDAAEIDLGQEADGCIGLYAPELDTTIDTLKANGTEYAAGLFLCRSAEGEPIYQIVGVRGETPV